MAVAAAERPPAEGESAGLKANAIGFVDALVIGLASTAPAYSLAAVLGTLVVIVGVQAPAALLASFVPMFFIAAAFYYMNRADPDAGTTFSWVTRALGPYPGWLGGWAVCVTGILTRSVSNFLFIGVAPLVGAALLSFLFFQSVKDFSDPGASYTGQSVFGLGVPLVIGLGFLGLGFVFMILWRLGGHERFFGRSPLEAVDPDVAAGRVAVAETAELDEKGVS